MISTISTIDSSFWNATIQQLQLQVSNPNSKTLVLCLAAVLGLAYTLSRDGQRRPSLVSYRYPIVGNTFDYKRDPTGFVRRAVDKYGPTFRANINGRVVTIVSTKDHIKKVVSLEEQLDFISAIHDTFKAGDALGKLSSSDRQAMTNIIVKYLTPHLKEFSPRVLEQLEKGVNMHLGDFEGSKTLDNPASLISDMIVKASASIFVGTELCENPELTNSFRTLTMDIGAQMDNSGLLGFFPWLSGLRQQFYFWYFSPTARHRDVIKRIVIPVIEQRRKEMAELGDKWERPDDALQQIIEVKDAKDPEFVTKTILSLVFASIHTTSANTTLVLQHLANNPEWIGPLRDEVEAALANPESDGQLTANTIRKLAKLDSFIRETFRTTEEGIAFPHKNLTHAMIDLGDGAVVGPGEHVSFNMFTVKMDEAHGAEPEAFDPWRFVGKGKSASKVGTDYLKFGMGKHACPGRFLAIQEIKTAICFLLLRYDFEAVKGDDGRPTKAIVFTKLR